MHAARSASKLGVRTAPHTQKLLVSRSLLNTIRLFLVRGPEVVSIDINRRIDPRNEEQNEIDLKTCLRVSHATEGQQWALGNRLDAKHFTEASLKHLSNLETLSQKHQASNSSLLPLLKPVGFLTGAVTALSPLSAQRVVHGAIQDSLVDTYNDQIRSLMQDGSLERDLEMKELYLKLRDEDRMPSGAIPPPDLSRLQRIEELSMLDGIGVAVKGICNVTTKIIERIK